MTRPPKVQVLSKRTEMRGGVRITDFLVEGQPPSPCSYCCDEGECDGPAACREVFSPTRKERG